MVKQEITNEVEEVSFKCDNDESTERDAENFIKKEENIELEEVALLIDYQKCENCQNWIKKSNFVTHARTCVIDGYSLRCGFENCNRTFETLKKKKSHQKRAHSLFIKCPQEGCQDLVRPTSLKSHLTFKHMKLKTECETCKKVLSTSSMWQHRQRCGRQDNHKFICTSEDCQKSFKTKHNLSIHKYKVHAQPAKCPYVGCGRILKPACLLSHINMVHQKLRCMCNFCGKEMKKSHLLSHQKLSCKPSPLNQKFICHIKGCKAKFTVKDARDRHIFKSHLPIDHLGQLQNEHDYMRDPWMVEWMKKGSTDAIKEEISTEANEDVSFHEVFIDEDCSTEYLEENEVLDEEEDMLKIS